MALRPVLEGPVIRIPAGMVGRVDAADPRGVLHAIQVRPARHQPPVAVQAWDLTGTADHARGDKRAVTLIQAEHLPVIAALLGRPVAFELTRRNLLVSGLNLGVLLGRRFAVGDVVLEGTQSCHPCVRMEEALGSGGYAAMMGHGGLCARVVVPGTVRVGDALRLVFDGQDVASTPQA